LKYLSGKKVTYFIDWKLMMRFFNPFDIFSLENHLDERKEIGQSPIFSHWVRPQNRFGLYIRK